MKICKNQYCNLNIKHEDNHYSTNYNSVSICSCCFQREFPFSKLFSLNCVRTKDRIKDLNRMEYEILKESELCQNLNNDINLCFKDIRSKSCLYYTIDEFNKTTDNKLCDYSIHLNLRSIHKNFESLQIMLESLKVKLDAFAITETWLAKSDMSVLMLNVYNMHYINREFSKGGGVCIYAKNSAILKLIEGLSLSEKGVYGMYSFSSATKEFWCHVYIDHQIVI